LNHPAFDLVIYANVTNFLPNRLISIRADDSVDAARKAIQDNCQILLVRLCDRDVNPDFIRTISGSDLNVIVWAHNNPSSLQMNIVASCTNISRLVCVGREELDLLRDHPVIYKTTCIFNGIHPSTYAPDHHIVKTGTTVVYMGSLVREKGFHILAKVWHQVKARAPSAVSWSLAPGRFIMREPSWVVGVSLRKTMNGNSVRFLSDEEGNPDASVEFLGRLGAEKISILQQADIGVVNPNRNPHIGTETFCLSAVEFEACGVPVVSAAEDGLLDTVVHGQTGLLIHNERSLSKYIVLLLEDRGLREQYGRNAMEFVQSEFDYKKICPQWQSLFFDVIHDQPNTIYPMKSNVFTIVNFCANFYG